MNRSTVVALGVLLAGCESKSTLVVTAPPHELQGFLWVTSVGTRPCADQPVSLTVATPQPCVSITCGTRPQRVCASEAAPGIWCVSCQGGVVACEALLDGTSCDGTQCAPAADVRTFNDGGLALGAEVSFQLAPGCWDVAARGPVDGGTGETQVRVQLNANETFRLEVAP